VRQYPARWPVRLTASAEADIEGILRWSTDQCGDAQAHTYAEALSSALQALATGGPAAIGVRPHEDIGSGLFTLHVAREGRTGRHFVLFRLVRADEVDVIDVLRLVHDAMDPPRDLPAAL